MITFQQENDQLMNSFLERTYFNAWKNPNSPSAVNFDRLEIFLTSRCNLRCKYCYLANFGESLYPPEVAGYSTVMRNLGILCDWLVENKMYPRIDFFSGEPLTQKLGRDALSLILDKFSKTSKRPSLICIPTNFTFLMDDRLTQWVEELIERGKSLGVRLSLSASFDGKFCESNRPLRSGKDFRDDKFYDKCFEFAARHKFGFHPMIYSEKIERWKENFLWFQHNFRRFGIPFDSIYLLEVRNVEWDDAQIREYMDFVRFLIRWTFEVPCESDKKKFLTFLFDRRGYNLLSAPLSTIGRGIGCSLQSCLYVRVGDLAIVPCHRTSYPQNTLAKFVVKNGKIVGLESKNVELLIGTITYSMFSQPQCESCTIKYLCQGQCPGSMLEVTGDMFSPIPTVCKLYHAKIMSMIQGFKEIGVYGVIKNRINEKKVYSLEYMERLMEELDGRERSLQEKRGEVRAYT